jgi:c-di-GMP-binding flagellar brake protein YcgR
MELVHNINQVDLKPGDKLFFETELAEKKVQISASYVGNLRDKYIISELPVSKTGPLFQHTDSKCTIRFMSRGTIYGFTSRVAAISHNPMPIIFIGFPSKIEKINLRKEDRFRVFIPIELSFEGMEDVKEQEGTITDLSKSGCRIIAPIYCDKDDELMIKFKGSKDGEIEPVKGIVRNSRAINSSTYELGIQYVKPYSQVEEVIVKLEYYLQENC